MRKDSPGDAFNNGLNGRLHFGPLLWSYRKLAIAKPTGPFATLEHDSSEPEAESVLVAIIGARAPGEGPSSHSVFDVVSATAGDEHGPVQLQ
jgi:hypothetical protein